MGGTTRHFLGSMHTSASTGSRMLVDTARLALMLLSATYAPLLSATTISCQNSARLRAIWPTPREIRTAQRCCSRSCPVLTGGRR